MSTKFRPITHIITRSDPVNPWPPTGSYLLCARLYTNTFLDHITVNTVSWNYDGGSSPTYSDANCTQVLNYLSGWDDGTVNTVLQTTGQNEYGTYVDIFTDNSRSSESAVDFCVILGNDRRQTITDDSWKITRVEVFKVGMTNGIYRVNNSPYKGQWFRNRNDWTEFPLTPQSSTIFRPISIFENIPLPPSHNFTLYTNNNNEYGWLLPPDILLNAANNKLQINISFDTNVSDAVEWEGGYYMRKPGQASAWIQWVGDTVVRPTVTSPGHRECIISNQMIVNGLTESNINTINDWVNAGNQYIFNGPPSFETRKFINPPNADFLFYD